MWFQSLEWLHNGNSLLKWTTFFSRISFMNRNVCFFLVDFFPVSGLSKTEMNMSWDKIVYELFSNDLKRILRKNVQRLWKCMTKFDWHLTTKMHLSCQLSDMNRWQIFREFQSFAVFFRPKNSLKPNDRSQINEQNHLMFLKISSSLTNSA